MVNAPFPNAGKVKLTSSPEFAFDSCHLKLNQVLPPDVCPLFTKSGDAPLPPPNVPFTPPTTSVQVVPLPG